MERTKNKLPGLIVLFLFSVLTVTAQQKDLTYYKCALFESYRIGDMSPWPKLIAEMESVHSNNLDWQTEILKANYGFVGYLLGKRNKDLAREYVNKADIKLDKLLKLHPQNARLNSLAGAFYGYKIALSFYKAPFLGPKSMYYISKSIELDPKEPMGYIEKGNSLMYRPVAFGGDKKEGLDNYRKALRLMDAGIARECNWQKLLLRAFILKGLYETKQNAEANAFRIEMQKDYGSMDWIKDFVGTDLIDKK